MRTTAVCSVCVIDTPDVQCHSEVHRQPRVRCCVGAGTERRLMEHCPSIAVVGVPGVLTTSTRVDVRTDLVRRTVESHVHIESTIHKHCCARHMTTLSFP